MIKVSVNLITHNRAQYIADAITSVLEQSLREFELIIVDDASSDETVEVIKPFLSDSRVKYFFLNKQKRLLLCSLFDAYFFMKLVLWFW